MKDKNLARLVERARRGDQDAFTGLYDKLSKSVYYIGLRMTKNEQDARDIVQETMLRLHKDLGFIKHAEAVDAYVSRIAMRLCIDFLRKKQTFLMGEDMEQSLSNEPDDDEDFIPEEYLHKKEQREYIISLIEELSEPQRAVILLYYHRQLSMKQIAGILGLGEAAVKMRLSRARTALKQRLENDVKNMGTLIMSTSVLAKILEIDANAAFTPEISAQIWSGIAANLGYQAVAATAVTAETAVGASGAATTTVATASTMNATSLLSAIIITAAATGIVGGGAWIYQHSTKTAAPPPVTPISQDVTARPPAEVITEQPRYDYKDITPDTPDGADIQQAEDAPNGNVIPYDVPEAQSDNSVPAPNTAEILSGTQVGDVPATIPDDSAGATTPAGSSNQAGSSDRAGSSVQAGPAISVEKRHLTYTEGEQVTPQSLVTDAGIRAVGANGAQLLIHIEHFDQVDFNKPDNYAVYARITDADGFEWTQIVIVISIMGVGANAN